MPFPVIIAYAAITAAATIYAAKTQADAAKMQGDYANMQGLLSAEAQAKAGVSKMIAGYTRANLLRMQSDLVGETMDNERMLLKEKAANFRSMQRAAMGASGVDINSGSFKSITSQTSALEARDAYVIMRMGLNKQANLEFEAVNQVKIGQNQFQQSFYAGVNDRVNANYATKAASLQAQSAMIQGGLSAASTALSGYGNQMSADKAAGGGFGSGSSTILK